MLLSMLETNVSDIVSMALPLKMDIVARSGGMVRTTMVVVSAHLNYDFKIQRQRLVHL